MFEKTTEATTQFVYESLQAAQQGGFISDWFPSLEKACFTFAVAIFALVILIALIMGSRLSEFAEKKKIEERKKIHGGKPVKEDSKFMDQLSKMVEDILENDSDKEVTMMARNKIKGSNLPPSYKIKRMLKDMMTNPYNPISVPKMIIVSAILGMSGFGLGLFIENFIFCVALAIVGIALPIIFVNVSALNNQLKILQGNLGLMASHLGIYKESNNVADSFRSLLNVLTPDTREYNAIYKAHGAIVEANLDLYEVIEALKHDLLTDTIVGQYLDLCYISDTKSAEYKDALDYLPRRLEPIVMKNIVYTTMVKTGFIAYIICAGIIIFTLFFYKFTDYNSFQFFTASLPGMIMSFSIMALYILLGYGFTKISNLITI